MASIIHQYYNAFMIKYADTLLPGHLKAMNAILGCRTPNGIQLRNTLIHLRNCHFLLKI